MKIHYVDITAQLIEARRYAKLRGMQIDCIELCSEEWDQLADKVKDFGPIIIPFSHMFRGVNSKAFNILYMGMHVKLTGVDKCEVNNECK